MGYTFGNLFLLRRACGAVKRDFRPFIRRYTSLNENLNMVIPIIMLFCSFASNLSVASRKNPHTIQRYVKLLMTSNYFRQSSQDMMSQIFDVIQSDAALQNQAH